jgi:hypothetical protein
MPDEGTILCPFSREWVDCDWNEQSYWGIGPDVMHKSMNFLLDRDRRPVKDKLVLEAGIGIGQHPFLLRRARERPAPCTLSFPPR